MRRCSRSSKILKALRMGKKRETIFFTLVRVFSLSQRGAGAAMVEKVAEEVKAVLEERVAMAEVEASGE